MFEVLGALIGVIVVILSILFGWLYKLMRNNEERITDNMRTISETQKDIATICERLSGIEKLNIEKFKNAEEQRGQIIERLNKLNGDS